MSDQTPGLAPEVRTKLTMHGLGGVLAGTVGGLSFLFNILKFIEIFPFVPRINYEIKGSETSWRATHTGPIMNGLMLMAIASAGDRIDLKPGEQQALTLALVVTMWGNTVGYNTAALGGQRGLAPHGHAMNNFTFFSFLTAALAVLFAVPLALLGIRRHSEAEAAADQSPEQTA